jgi:hypothetical protein
MYHKFPVTLLDLECKILKLFLPILILIFCIPNLAKSQGICGTYDGYLQDDINKYPAFYKSIEEKNIQLEQKNKELVSNLNE